MSNQRLRMSWLLAVSAWMVVAILVNHTANCAESPEPRKQLSGTPSSPSDSGSPSSSSEESSHPPKHETNELNVFYNEPSLDDTLELCEKDPVMADVCLSCAMLPEELALPVSLCCADDTARSLCETCLADPEYCLEKLAAVQQALITGFDGTDVNEKDDVIASDDFAYDVSESDGDDDWPVMSKRYGMLFLGKRPLHHYPSAKDLEYPDIMKKSDVGFPYDDVEDEVEKRWGTLGLGSRYGYIDPSPWMNLESGGRGLIGKRWGNLGIGNGKRWGTLGLGNGKRWGTLGLSRYKKWGTLGIGNGKRWGTLGVGKRWGTLGIGKRWGTLGIGKRWGSLGLGRGRYPDWFRTYKRGGKQNDENPQDLDKYLSEDGELDEYPWDEEGEEGVDEDKRWGSLGLGGSGSRWGMDKRWGSLGLGRGRGLWGVRSSNPGEGHDVDKRWGSLGLGRGRSLWGFRDSNPEKGHDVDKRWGSLSLNKWRKRWGQLSLGHYRGKRWGHLGLHRGKRPERLTNLDTAEDQYLSDDDDNDDEKRWGTLSLGGSRWGIRNDKRWGSLGLKGNRWGFRNSGHRDDKRWGSLGLGGNRWGTSGHRDDKRWGSLSLGNRLRSLAAKEGVGLGGRAKRAEPLKQAQTPSSSSSTSSEKLGREKRAGTLQQAQSLSSSSFSSSSSQSSTARRKKRSTLARPEQEPSSLSVASSSSDAEGLDPWEEEKRWGSLGLGKNKRWGTLGLGKRWGTLGLGKRWGTLGLGKRWGTLGLGKRWGTLGLGKRWGSLGLGKNKRWGTLGLDKHQGTVGLDKERWGTFILENKHRGTFQSDNNKRWGTLGLGKKREDSGTNDAESQNENPISGSQKSHAFSR